MGVFRDIELVWRGTSYSVTPTMRLMRSIEMGEVSLTDIAIRTAQGRPPISHIAFVLAKMLQSVGAQVTDDEVYSVLMAGEQAEVVALINVVLTAFSPGERDPKKSDAQPAS